MSLGQSSLWAITSVFALSFSSPAWADLGPDPGPDIEVTDSAREQFRVGVALLQDPDGARYEEAYKAFTRAYKESPSWKILGNLGLCALKLERFTDGIVAYERYLKYAGPDLSEAERTQTERDLRVMKATSGKVVLTFEGATGVVLRDTHARAVGGPIANTYEAPDGAALELYLASGEHTLVATAGDRRAEIHLKVESGVTYTEVLTLKAEEEAAAEPAATKKEAPEGATQETVADTGSGNGLKVAGYIVAGTGVAALIGGGVTTFLGLGIKGDLDDRCPDGTCVPTSASDESDLEADKKRLGTYGTLSTILFISGGALTAGGITMIMLSSKKGGDEQVSVRLSPSVVPTFAGLFAQGAF